MANERPIKINERTPKEPSTSFVLASIETGPRKTPSVCSRPFSELKSHYAADFSISMEAGRFDPIVGDIMVFFFTWTVLCFIMVFFFSSRVAASIVWMWLRHLAWCCSVYGVLFRSAKAWNAFCVGGYREKCYLCYWMFVNAFWKLAPGVFRMNLN